MDHPSVLPPEQWSRAKEIFYEAVDRPDGATNSFIQNECAGDAALQTAVESLLASDQAAADFLQTPAIAKMGLAFMVSSPMPVGHRLGPYEILGPLGAGGMGEVYRARDLRLGRDVALKILLADVTHDDTCRGWFKREARAAAALEHPNVCSIYDIGEQDERIWIAMQYVEGESLAERLRRSRFDVLLALDLAVQIANALEYAHGRGIVHRDIKPENVMITADARAKVLDFGLAKITNEAALLDELHQPQIALDSTRLGTAPYMSPEQVRGEKLDVRTDVFSLTVLVYELLTGRHPFEGGADGDVTAAILSVEPPVLTDYLPSAPQLLSQTIRRGLQKDREKRYQTMAELAADLERVKRSIQPHSTPGLSGRARVFAGAFALIASLTVGSLWFYRNNVVGPAPAVEYTQLTDLQDSVESPALSPDGTMLAFVRKSQTDAGTDLYVKVLPDGQPAALTHDGRPKDSVAFTPDGKGVIFAKGLTTYVVPAAGGMATPFMTNASGLRWTGPQQMLFSRMINPPHMSVFTINQSQSQARPVYVPKSVWGMAHFSERSPDGTQVLVVEMDNVWLPCRVVPFDGSSSGRRVGPTDGQCTAATWSPDGRWMYFAAAVKGESHIWRQRFPEGLLEQITFGPNQERGVAMAPDGKSLITAVGAEQSTVWYHDEHGDRPVSVEGYAYRPMLSPDERKVFYLIRRAAKRSFFSGELWVGDLKTGKNERLFPQFLISSYDISADGKYVVFDAFDKDDRARLWLALVDGNEPPRQLTPSPAAEEQRPFFGPSGDIYFMQLPLQGRASLNRMKPDGSQRRELVHTITFLVNVSPDERFAALWTFGDTSLLPLSSGTPRTLCTTCGMGPIFEDSPMVSWSSDNKTLFVGIPASSAPNAANNGKGTLVLPAEAIDTLRAPAPSFRDLQKFPGARYIAESSIAPGQTAARYAFARRDEQSNLYRIRLQ